ncbi:hypothetical protein J437_LFUL006570 [Ladona fulva]|uniref:Uncharacterized protein n=1 Tax=Ladona fulva TaxID=123851 RepID=A0A8K0K1Z7_LADFU|nr:hypothetical protein J437_LFUL006570 [Ladona fulva]
MTTLVRGGIKTGLPKALVKASEGLNSSIWMRRLTGIIVIALLATANLADMACCEWPQPSSNCTLDETPSQMSILPTPGSTNSTGSPTPQGRFARRVVGSGEEGDLERGDATSFTTQLPFLQTPSPSPSKGFELVSACPHPTYFTATAVLILSASSLISHLPQGWKTALMAVVATAHCLLLVLLHAPEDQGDCATLGREAAGSIQERYTLSCLLLAVTIALAFLNRHTEKASRLLFLWRREVEERRERASEMRRRNEALVGNVLPPHVASHFLGGRRRSHDELYSQSYAEVGVLFASMPNFSGTSTDLFKGDVGLSQWNMYWQSYLR